MTTSGSCRVLLIGMMGSGKSTIGRLVSEATGWPYVDNDELVRRAHGATAREILAEHGEQRMRDAESDALLLGIETPAPAVVAVAAGTVLDRANRERLRDGGIVVWLRADADILEARARGADHRPFVDTGGRTWITDAVRERAPLYASVSDIVIDTGALSPTTAAAELVQQLRRMSPCRGALG